MITCRICGAAVRRITKNGHLRKHDLSTAEYTEMFPDAPLTSDETKRALVAAHARPEIKEKHRAGLVSAFSKPEMVKKMHAAKLKMWAGNDARRAKTSSATAKRMQDKALVEGMVAKSKTPEAIAKKSSSLKGRNAGEKSGHWRGGITYPGYFERGGYDFKVDVAPAIRSRDGFKCLSCGMSQDESLARGWGILHVHHDDEDSANNHPDNLLTLCRSCHTSTHNQRRSAS